MVARAEWKTYPALDGIRALAIGMVLALHGARTFAPGGFLGVDLFFTLSGFLITGVLLSDQGKYGAIRFWHFWARRARRILPPLGVLLLLAFALWFGMPAPWPSFADAALPAAFYFANIQATIDAGKLGALVHTWSLSTEEQFYLLWPMLLGFLLRKPRATACTAVALIVVAASCLCIGLHALGSPLASYYSPLVRIGELLAGCLLAMLPSELLQRGRRAYRLAAWLFLASWPVLLLTLSPASPGLYVGGFTLFALGSASLLAVAVDPAPTQLQRWLSAPWLVAIGKRSYGIYLFHLPIFMWFEAFRVHHDAVNFLLILAARLGCTAIITELSYRFIERPLLALGSRANSLSVVRVRTLPGVSQPRQSA